MSCAGWLAKCSRSSSLLGQLIIIIFLCYFWAWASSSLRSTTATSHGDRSPRFLSPTNSWCKTNGHRMSHFNQNKQVLRALFFFSLSEYQVFIRHPWSARKLLINSSLPSVCTAVRCGFLLEQQTCNQFDFISFLVCPPADCQHLANIQKLFWISHNRGYKTPPPPHPPPKRH